MNANLLMEFSIDKENNTITVKREFAANLQLLWDVHTKSDFLDNWFAPKPLTTKTKSMSFKEGGHWHYAMIEPNGTEYWGRLDYLKIQPINSYSAFDGFTDATGEINPELPRSKWEVTFSELGKNGIVQTLVSYNSLTDLEAVLKMGMQEGLTSTLERLDEYLLILNG